MTQQVTETSGQTRGSVPVSGALPLAGLWKHGLRIQLDMSDYELAPSMVFPSWGKSVPMGCLLGTQAVLAVGVQVSAVSVGALLPATSSWRPSWTTRSPGAVGRHVFSECWAPAKASWTGRQSPLAFVSWELSLRPT